MSVGREIAANNLRILQAYRDNLLVSRQSTNAPNIKSSFGTNVVVQSAIRLDTLLAQRYGITASLLNLMIRKRLICVERQRVDGQGEEVKGLRDPKTSLIRPWFPLRTGDVVTMPTVRLREKQENTVLYEDAQLMAVEKQPGQCTVPYQGCEPLFPLDRQVGGILLYPKNASIRTKLLNGLGGAAGRTTPRIRMDYLAMVLDRPQYRAGRIMTNLYGRIKARFMRIAKNSTATKDEIATKEETKEPKVGGKAVALIPESARIVTTVATRRSDLMDEGRVAITLYKHLADHIHKDPQGKRHKLSLLRLTPITGHPHQLRVHCAETLECPILGDHLYGWRYRQQPRMATAKLHLQLHRIRIDGYHGPGKHLEIKAGLSERFMRTMDRYPMFKRSPPKRLT